MPALPSVVVDTDADVNGERAIYRRPGPGLPHEQVAHIRFGLNVPKEEQERMARLFVEVLRGSGHG